MLYVLTLSTNICRFATRDIMQCVIIIMHADIIALSAANESPSLSPPARKRIPSFLTFFPLPRLQQRVSKFVQQLNQSSPLDTYVSFNFFFGFTYPWVIHQPYHRENNSDFKVALEGGKCSEYETLDSST